MWDKNDFYYLEKIDDKEYNLDIWASSFLTISNNKYVVFHKRNFKKVEANKLQKWFSLITRIQDIDFVFSEEFFIYGLTYYQRNLKLAHFKWGDLDTLETYSDLFEKFWLKLKLRKYLEIHWDYLPLEELALKIKYADLNQVISFILALATIYWDWNLIEENDNLYLNNVLIKFPFDSSLADFQQMIFDLEDVLINNKLYNSLVYTKKGEFIWNIKDFDLLKIFWNFLIFEKVKDFFQVYDEIKPIYELKLSWLKNQLFTDLRVKLDKFKLTEIEWIQIKI